MNDGRKVALRRFQRTKRSYHEVKDEITALSILDHANIVRCIGFCLEVETVLVYEDMPKGSLDTFIIHNRTPCFPLFGSKNLISHSILNCYTVCLFLFIFDRSSYSKYLLKYIKLSYVKILFSNETYYKYIIKKYILNPQTIQVVILTPWTKFWLIIRK